MLATCIDIWTRYLSELRQHAWLFPLAAAIACMLKLLWDRAGDTARRALHPIALIATLAVGVAFVWSRASVFDDAFISFRYARNLLDGHGLVWNASERVEGYTNFLWTVLVAALAWVSRVELPAVGLFASIAAYLVLVSVVYRIERALAGEERGVLPLATALVAIQGSVVTAGSTGLETGFASALVCAGALCLVGARRAVDFGMAGLWLILATLARPDHAIFYAAAAAVLVWDQASQLWRREIEWRAALRVAFAFGSPFLLYLAHLAWRLWYYGALLPNTYYAKSADLDYYEQGAIYAATFYVTSHFWLLLLPLIAWLAWPATSKATARFKLFTGIAFAVYNLYVVKIGGDFMFGRFFVVLVPLVLLSLAQAARELSRVGGRAQWVAVALTALLGATAGGVSIFPARKERWRITDERTFYPVSSLDPVVIDHTSFRIAKMFAQWREAGIELRVATSAIGMIGYYSRYEILDLLGLTDAVVAHQTLKKRSRPGHEKHASPAYLARRNPHIVLNRYNPSKYDNLTEIYFDRAITKGRWFIYHYDRAVMERIAQIAPTARFKRFDNHLKSYMSGMSTRSLREIEEDARFFQRYYFDHSADSALASQWQAALHEARSR